MSGHPDEPTQVWRAPYWWLYRSVSCMFGALFVAAVILGIVEGDVGVLAGSPVFAVMSVAFYAPSIPLTGTDLCRDWRMMSCSRTPASAAAVIRPARGECPENLVGSSPAASARPFTTRATVRSERRRSPMLP